MWFAFGSLQSFLGLFSRVFPGDGACDGLAAESFSTCFGKFWITMSLLSSCHVTFVLRKLFLEYKSESLLGVFIFNFLEFRRSRYINPLHSCIIIDRTERLGTALRPPNHLSI
jgi:hypothetical protein